MASDLYLNNLRCWNSKRNRFHEDVFSHHLLPYGFFRGSTFELLHINHTLNPARHIDVYGVFRKIVFRLNEAREKLNADKMPKRFMSKPYGDGQSQPAIVICFHLSLVLENYHQFFVWFHSATLMPSQPFFMRYIGLSFSDRNEIIHSQMVAINYWLERIPRELEEFQAIKKHFHWNCTIWLPSRFV